VLAIPRQYAGVLADVVYFSLRTFVAVLYFSLRALAVPSVYRILTPLALIWLYIIIAGAPPSVIRAGVVATLVLAAGLLGRQVAHVR
jgi:predicted membrane metal-binding protein